ncbi:MAG: hypothetical protein ACOCX5_03625 [Chloroflexota bacterium]
MRRKIAFVLVAVALLVLRVQAQTDSVDDVCPAIVETALASTDALCEGTGRNQVCYGNLRLNATPQDEAAAFSFDDVGDVIDVAQLAALRLSPMDVDVGEWGVALMRLQANLPDTLPGQNVTFIMFGDVEIVNNVTGDMVTNEIMTPMQSFYLTTGIGDARCREAPESGVLVQTPEGVGQINLVVNEVEVQLGSTALLQAENKFDLNVTTLEGSAVLRDPTGRVYTVIAGTSFRIQIIPERTRIVPRMRLPETYTADRVNPLPIDLLERDIEVRQPLNKDELNTLYDRWEQGEVLCGEFPFPPCDALPEAAGGTPCVLPNPDGTRPEGVSEDRPLCKVEETEAQD